MENKVDFENALEMLYDGYTYATVSKLFYIPIPVLIRHYHAYKIKRKNGDKKSQDYARKEEKIIDSSQRKFQACIAAYHYYAKGNPIKKSAKKFKISVPVFYKYLCDHNLKRLDRKQSSIPLKRMKRRKYDYEEIHKLLSDGVLIIDVAKKLSISYKVVYKYAKKKNFQGCFIKPRNGEGSVLSTPKKTNDIQKKVGRHLKNKGIPFKGSSNVCLFCHQPAIRELELGKLHHLGNVVCHYYCLLFSSSLEQNGEDNEGILGFLSKDILHDLKRGKAMKLALSAGYYYYKCPLCNDKDTFLNDSRTNGIYVPEQDASWELEPNAFQDLLERPKTCEANTCLCPTGRNTNTRATEWAITVCELCGSCGSHKGCIRDMMGSQWTCSECQQIMQTMQREKKMKVEEETRKGIKRKRDLSEQRSTSLNYKAGQCSSVNITCDDLAFRSTTDINLTLANENLCDINVISIDLPQEFKNKLYFDVDFSISPYALFSHYIERGLDLPIAMQDMRTFITKYKTDFMHKSKHQIGVLLNQVTTEKLLHLKLIEDFLNEKMAYKSMIYMRRIVGPLYILHHLSQYKHICDNGFKNMLIKRNNYASEIDKRIQTILSYFQREFKINCKLLSAPLIKYQHTFLQVSKDESSDEYEVFLSSEQKW